MVAGLQLRTTAESDAHRAAEAARRLARDVAPFGILDRESRLGQIVRRHASSVPLVVALGLGASALEGISIGLLIPLASALFSDELPAGVPGPIRAMARFSFAIVPEQRIVAIGGLIVGLVALKCAVQILGKLVTARIEFAVEDDVRKALAQRILEFRMEFFIDADLTRLVKIAGNDSWSIGHTARAWLSILTSTAGLLVLGSILLWLDWRLFAVALASAALAQAALGLVERWEKHLSERMTPLYSSLYQRMMSIIHASRTIRMFGQQDVEYERFSEASRHVGRGRFAGRRLLVIVSPTVELAISILVIGIIVASFRLGIGVAEVTVFLLILLRCQPHAIAISHGRSTIAGEQGAMREVEWLLRQEPGANPRPGTASIDRLARDISFQGVSFTYPDGRRALHDVSFTLRYGTTTALLGESGAGKTTLVNLLCRLIEPHAGKILHGDESIDRIEPKAWRRRIALAGQDLDLIDGTIAENIAYGRPAASREDIEKAARIAGAAAFIAALPDGYDTPVGEALGLSGGQRQRVALARAVLVRPDLLILDEALNAVDALSETEVMRLLDDRKRFPTVLLISHRRSTLMACREGVTLRSGTVVESGPLPDLEYFRSLAESESRSS